MLPSLLGIARGAAPLDPDAGTARDLLSAELAKSEYLQAQPTPFDRFAEEFARWVQSLTQGAPDSALAVNPALLLIAVPIILGILAFVIFGRPRALARRARAAGAAVFLDDDTRSAAELRSAAESAAARQEWDLAVAERFRAISRSLTDRTLLQLRPGTTAQAVARRASEPFPGEARDLHAAADLFDAVRYLSRPSDKAGYEFVRDLDDRLTRARPAHRLEPVGAAR